MAGFGGIGFARNSQAGNPRSGQFYRTVQGNGGVFHVYGGGKRVFVPGAPRNLGRGNLLAGVKPGALGSGASSAPPDMSGDVAALRRQVSAAGGRKGAGSASQQSAMQQAMSQFMRMNGYG